MRKLVIIDDEIDVREFAKSFFLKRDIDVYTAEDGLAGLEIIEKEVPDLVLLDITMERMSGVELLKELRKRKNDVKIIMVTGIEDENTINEAKSWGICGFIHKPLVLEELEKIVMAELNNISD